MKEYCLKGMKKNSENFPGSEFSQNSPLAFLRFSLLKLLLLSTKPQQAPSLTISQKDTGSLIKSPKSFRQVSYAGNLPDQMHHRVFQNYTKDILQHIWLEQITSCQTATLLVAYRNGVKVKGECWKPKEHEIISAGAGNRQNSNRIMQKISEYSEYV